MESPLKRRRLVVNGALGVLLAAGVGVAYLSLADDGDATTAASRTTKVVRGAVRSTVSASGSVEGARTRSLSFATSGTVTKIYVKQGEKVKAGQVLAKLDQTAALESLRAAKANLAVAAEGDTSTTQGYASYISAKNGHNSAARQYAGTLLTAPISGTVTAINGTTGGSSSGGSSSDSGSSSSSSTSGSSSSGGTGGSATSSSSGTSSGSSSGSGFIELSDLSKVEVTGSFTEADTTKIKAGQSATVSFDALNGVTATGKVVAIDMAATTSNNVVQYGVTIRLAKKPAAVRIGQTSTVTIVTATASNVLYVPTVAVRTVGGQSTVTVVQNGRQVAKTVQIGVKGDQGTEITSGLNEGDEVTLTSTTTGTGTSGAGQSGGGIPGGGVPGGGVPGGGGRP